MAPSINSAAAKHAEPLEEEPIPAEILAVIAAAAATFLGTKFHIRGIELQHSPRESVSRWLQVGRATVQASHNPRLK